VPKDAAVVEAVGQQWQWSFRFPGNDGVLGTVNTRLVSPDNPFGLDPKDPYGRDDILVEGNEVHLPRGRPIKVVLRSKDVLHDFFVPQIRARMDLVPGTVTYFWFTPTRAGRFEILCAELCGIGHYTMRGALVVDEEPAFKTWLGQQPTFAQLMAEAGPGTTGSPAKSAN
jgi:cytochrome c oxidase subunit 2